MKSKPINRQFGAALLFASSVTLLAACGGGGGGDGGNNGGGGGPGNVNVTDDQAKTAAQGALQKGLSGGLDNAQSILQASGADNALMSMISPDLVTMYSALEGTGSGSGSGGVGVVDETEGVLEAFVGSASRNGDVITYTADAHEVCAMETVENLFSSLTGTGADVPPLALSRHTDGEPDACTEVVSHITLVQTLTSETSGTLTYKFDDFSPIVLGYSDNGSSVQINLADTKSTIAEIASIVEPDATLTLPDMSGSVKLAQTQDTATQSTLTLSLPDAVSISGLFDGDAVDISLAQTDKLIEVVGDTATNEGSIEFAMNAMNLSLPIYDDADVSHPAQFSMGGLTGLITLAAASDTLTVTNLGLNGQPITLKVDSIDAFKLAMVDVDMHVDGATQSATFDNGLDISLDVANVANIMDDTLPTTAAGTMSMSAPAATVIQAIPGTTPAEMVTKVTAGGPFALSGTGMFTGDALSVNVGECYAENSADGLPFVTAVCP